MTYGGSFSANQKRRIKRGFLRNRGFSPKKNNRGQLFLSCLLYICEPVIPRMKLAGRIRIRQSGEAKHSLSKFHGKKR